MIILALEPGVQSRYFQIDSKKKPRETNRTAGLIKLASSSLRSMRLDLNQRFIFYVNFALTNATARGA